VTCDCPDPVVFGCHCAPLTFNTGETFTISGGCGYINDAGYHVTYDSRASRYTATPIPIPIPIQFSYGNATLYINNQEIGVTTGPIQIQYTRCESGTDVYGNVIEAHGL
jgi:hypothetical protein